MANSKFSVDGPALERSTLQVIQPNHIILVQEEEGVLEAGVDTQLFQIPPGLPAPQEEQEENSGNAQENSLVLKCIMRDSRDPLHAFQEGEHYLFGVDSGSDSDVPEDDELIDEMEDISCDEDQLVPVSLPETEGPTEVDHGLPSPGNIPVDHTFAIEENIEPSVVNRLHVTPVNVLVTDPEDPCIPQHLDEMEDIVAAEEDQLVPVNSQEAKHFTEGDHDKPSPLIIPVEYKCTEQDPVNLPEEEDPTFQGDRDQLSPGSIPLEDITAVQKDQLDPENLQDKEDPTEEDHDLPSPGIIPVEKLSSEEDHLIPVKFPVEENPTEGDHDQPSRRPGNIQLEDITAIEGNETGPVNLHVTLVNVQVTEPEDPSTPRSVDFNITTFDSVYREAGQEVIPEIQLDVKVETVTTTSAARGESSSSGQILMDVHVDPKPPESAAEDSYELLPEAVNGESSPDSKGVNETPLTRAIEAGAPET